MSKRPIEFAKQWLQKAKNDLFTADILLEKNRVKQNLIYPVRPDM